MSLRNCLRSDAFVKAVIFCVFVVFLWLGIHSLVIIAEGNRDPSLPMSTPCPVLNASTMPTQYQLEGSWGWHMRTRVKGLPPGLDIVVENRCFNLGIGSGFLWVNNQLAAFSRIDREIYDCHGQRIYNTAYDSYINAMLKLKVYDDAGKYLWASDIPDHGKELLIYGQPEDQLAATISSGSQVTVLNPHSPAADPRLIIMLYAPCTHLRTPPRYVTRFCESKLQ